MAQVTAALVKELRDKTGAGMMDCKKALAESDGDVEQAVDWLRAKGLAAAAKKAGRVAAEGLVGVVAEGTSGAVVEINSETDFVARNEDFQQLVEKVAVIAHSVGGELDKLQATPFGDTGRTVEEQVQHEVASIGENLTLRRSAAVSVGKGLVASYVHNAQKPGLGQIGVLVALESEADPVKLGELGKHLAMHVAAAAPQFTNVDSVDPEARERERAILAEQAKGSGKPDDIVAKMVEGRLRKFYEQVVLTEQTYVIDGESRVADVLQKAGKELGSPVKLAGFLRFKVGEGIEREEKDFAAEVAAQLS